MHAPAEEPSPPAPGARCAWHPTVEATVICARCGTFACQACATSSRDGAVLCTDCGTLTAVRLASPGDRLVAHLVDNVLVMIPMLLGAIVEDLWAWDVVRKPGLGPLAVLGGAGSVVLVGYQLYRAARTGQTLGKRMRNIRVVRPDGSRVSVGRLILRNVVPGALSRFGSVLALLGLVDGLMVFRNDRRCLHDLIAGTQVVNVDGPPARSPENQKTFT